MMAFIFSPLGRYAFAAMAVAIVIGGTYAKGRIDGRASYKEKIERQIKNAVEKGNDARDNALRELDAGRVPDAWFRDE